MQRVELKIRKEIPSPLWGGLGWGSLRPIHSSFFSTFKMRATPTPTLPTRGRGKSFVVLILTAQCANLLSELTTIAKKISKRLVALIAAQLLFSQHVGATSLFITDFFGVWRESPAACEDLNGTPFLEVVHNKDADFIRHGSKYCKLMFVPTAKFDRASIRFKVRNAKECSANGFPKTYLGTYSILVHGHLALKRENGEVLELVDCGVHGFRKYDEGNRKTDAPR